MNRTAKLRAGIILSLLGAMLLTSLAFGDVVFNLIEAQKDDTNGVDGLDGIFAVAISPDGEHVYSVATFDDAIALFSRETITGTLTYEEALFDNTGPVDGLEAVRDLVISPDGAHIYTAALIDDAVAAFSRNATTGQLTFIEAEFHDVGGVTGLFGAHGITISPDGDHVYVASLTSDAVVVFSRNSTTGELTFVQSLTNGQQGTTGLDGIRTLTVSPDGEFLYTASNDQDVGADDAVVVFDRDQATGEIEFVEAVFNDVNAPGLGNPAEVKVSPDGRHLYVGNENRGFGEDWYAVFSRNIATGELTYVESGVIGTGIECQYGVQDDTAILFRDGGSEVIMSGTWESGIYRFSRNTTTGALTVQEHLCTDLDNLDDFWGVRDLVMSPDETYLYGASFSTASLPVFSIGETSLTINYPDGAPGSYFTVLGHHYPAGETGIITVNGVLTDTITVDAMGNFSIQFNTIGADEGDYFVTVEVNPSATVTFRLDSSAPDRPQEGSGPVINIPAGIAFTEKVYLPMTLRD